MEFSKELSEKDQGLCILTSMVPRGAKELTESQTGNMPQEQIFTTTYRSKQRLFFRKVSKQET